MTGTWSLRRLWLVLYPFIAAAMAINLYMLSLIWVWFGLPVLTPYQALAGGSMLGIPVAYVFARQVRKLIAQSDQPL